MTETFTNYIDLQDCPEFYETVVTILINNEIFEDFDLFLYTHIYSKSSSKSNSWEKLLDELKSFECLSEYIESIKDGTFIDYIEDTLEEIRKYTIDVDKFLEKIIQNKDYYSEQFTKNFICKISYILTNIIPRTEIEKYVLMGGEILDGLTNMCYNCGTPFRTDLLYLMLYNGVSSKNIMKIFSESFGKKMCCKRSIFDNINLILTPYKNAKPLTRKYIIESFEEDILGQDELDTSPLDVDEITPVSSVFQDFNFNFEES